MRIVNWDGTIFGTGSEWFWAAAQFVLVAVSLVSIYRQLLGQGSANALARIAQLEGEWNSPRAVNGRLTVLKMLKADGRHPGGDVVLRANAMLNFFENLAGLHAQRFISLSEIETTWGRPIRVFWVLLKPAILEQRQLYRGDQVWEGFESLNNLLVEMRERVRGEPEVLDDAALAFWIDHAIDVYSSMLRDEWEWRRVELRETAANPTTRRRAATTAEK